MYGHNLYFLLHVIYYWHLSKYWIFYTTHTLIKENRQWQILTDMRYNHGANSFLKIPIRIPINFVQINSVPIDFSLFQFNSPIPVFSVWLLPNVLPDIVYYCCKVIVVCSILIDLCVWNSGEWMLICLEMISSSWQNGYYDILYSGY